MQALRPAGTVSAKAAGEGLIKKPRRVCRPWRQRKSKNFSAGACTWRKILFRLQVWNLSPMGGQIMRAAGCQSLSEKPFGLFRQSQRKRQIAASFFVYSPTKSFRMGVKMSSSTPFSRQVQPCSMPFSFSSVSPARTTLVCFGGRFFDMSKAAPHNLASTFGQRFCLSRDGPR